MNSQKTGILKRVPGFSCFLLHTWEKMLILAGNTAQNGVL
jgi:hypothetical protein